MVKPLASLVDVVERDLPAPKPNGLAPIAWSFQTETLPLAGAGDTLPAGVGQTIAREVCEAIGVRNLGTVDLVVTNAQANNRPEGLIGPGVSIVPPGMFVVLIMPGRFHSFYGRTGETVEVTRYPHAPASPIAVQGARRYFDVDRGNVAASAVVYVSPWGTAAVYGGFTARETTETNRAEFKLRDGGPAGTVIEEVSLLPGESTSDAGIDAHCASSLIFLEWLTGAFDFALRVN